MSGRAPRAWHVPSRGRTRDSGMQIQAAYSVLIVQVMHLPDQFMHAILARMFSAEVSHLKSKRQRLCPEAAAQ